MARVKQAPMVSKFALLCIAVLFFAGGMLANQWIARAPSRTSGAFDQGNSARVAGAGSEKAIEDLTAEIVRLRQAVEGLEHPPSAREEVEAPAARVDGEAQALVEELRALFRSTPNRFSSGSAAPGLVLPAPGFRPKDPPRVIMEEGGNLHEVNKQHILWTYQELLDAYGRPDEIKSNGSGLVWLYAGDGYKTAFYFVDGLVTSVWDE